MASRVDWAMGVARSAEGSRKDAVFTVFVMVRLEARVGEEKRTYW